MPNIYYKARRLWQLGQREQSFNLLNNYLEASLGQTVMLMPSNLYTRYPS
jgi:hypothetical protein